MTLIIGAYYKNTVTFSILKKYFFSWIIKNNGFFQGIKTLNKGRVIESIYF